MPEPSRRETRRAQRKQHQKRAVVVGLSFIIVVLLVNWGLIMKTHNPMMKKQSVDPVQSVTKIFKSTSTSADLKDAWKNDLKNSDSNVSIAVYSTKTGETYTYNTTPGHKYHMASTVKVSVLAGALINNGGELDSEGKEYATAMIENSDNDSTTSLIDDYVGGTDGMQQVFDKFQMSNTHAEDAWGDTTTTPSDQVKLLNNIFLNSNILTNSSRNYIKKLMSNVESDQQWGISAGSSKFYIKNGWLTEDDSDKWIINSIGYVKGANDNDYTIAVYTDNNSTMNSGEKLIEKLARSTKNVLDQ